MDKILESTYLRATISGPARLKGKIKMVQNVEGAIGIPRVINGAFYYAGNGIVIDEEHYISLDELIIDCGTSTTVI